MTYSVLNGVSLFADAYYTKGGLSLSLFMNFYVKALASGMQWCYGILSPLSTPCVDWYCLGLIKQLSGTAEDTTPYAIDHGMSLT